MTHHHDHEERRRELETGIEVVQNTLRRTIQERDEARAESDRVTLALNQQGDGGATEMGRIRDTAATLDYLTGALGQSARMRSITSRPSGKSGSSRNSR